jgi:hypothetical protein
MGYNVRMTIRTAFFGALAMVCACGGASGSETLIGAPCESSEECDVTGVCVTDAEGGICTQRCMVPGGAGQCPLGSYCTEESLTSDTLNKSIMTLCFPACKRQSDCRDGYRCANVSDGPGMVCQP